MKTFHAVGYGSGLDAWWHMQRQHNNWVALPHRLTRKRRSAGWRVGPPPEYLHHHANVCQRQAAKLSDVALEGQAPP